MSVGFQVVVKVGCKIQLVWQRLMGVSVKFCFTTGMISTWESAGYRLRSRGFCKVLV